MPHDPFAELTDIEVQQFKNKFVEKLKLTEKQIQVLEKETKRQHKCDAFGAKKGKYFIFF